jgi:acyl-[acyl-carrier-protein]-phospholipid O-acyltransferase/long-chain-fatty-acid--[acyl-carrier-protein] ligase
MAGVYFFGCLNDNFYRQSAMILAVAAGMAQKQSYILFLFTLPFIIFASYAGFLADRFSKRSVVIAARLFAVLIFIFGAVGLFMMSWPIALIAVFIMGVQATILSPAINGSIPELYPPEYVVTANGIFCVVNNAAILLGIAGAGIVLDADANGAHGYIPIGRDMAGGLVLIGALTALAVSAFVPKFPAAAPKAKFPWRGPVESLVTLIQTRRDALLAQSIFVKAFFWFAGSLQILIITPLGLTQFGLTKTDTSLMIVVELVGIGIGGLITPLFSKGEKWHRVLVPSSMIMAGSMLAVAAVPYMPAAAREIVVVAALAIMGIAGGILSIPVTSFVQVRPAPELKGRMIAASNLADFTGILLSSAVFYIFNLLCIKPSNCFAIEAFMVAAVAGWLFFALRKESIND